MEILKVAMTQLGIKEVKGAEHNASIVRYAQETEMEKISDDETPWCSTFVNWCAKESSLPMSKKANARSWMHVGITATTPIPGDVVVFWRESVHSWKGHVGIFMGFNHNASRVFCLGGNQGDQVSIAEYDANKVLGYRRLEEPSALKIPQPTLKKGDRGDEVTKLQETLNHLNYQCGRPDGDFGGKTDSAIRLFQANNRLTMDGVYGQGSKNSIESLLQS
ncbi:MAG: hypothetical protein COB04_00030 [Gammaproteobacteria bacterium]|nr:MAG: hypothetical protein COB04_00030 [Gammaproteobacteria bacterium]